MVLSVERMNTVAEIWNLAYGQVDHTCARIEKVQKHISSQKPGGAKVPSLADLFALQDGVEVTPRAIVAHGSGSRPFYCEATIQCPGDQIDRAGRAISGLLDQGFLLGVGSDCGTPLIVYARGRRIVERGTPLADRFGISLSEACSYFVVSGAIGYRLACLERTENGYREPNRHPVLDYGS